MRYAHVCTSCGVGLPAAHKAAAAEIFAKRADAQAAKGRRRPVTTNVSKYVARKAPAVARTLRKVLKAHAKRIAAKASRLYAEKLQKDTGAAARIQAIIDELDSEDLGVDLQGELEGPMLAAFKKAAAIGATQVGIEFAGITSQVDEAAVAFAQARGGELIKDLAGTTDDAMRSLLARAVDEGMGADELSSAIEDLGAFSDYRADLIARTELAFAHVQGNVEGWKASEQVEGKQWILADTHPEPDECDDAADAGVVGLDEEFADGIDYPPAHPGCVVSGTVVAPGGRITAHFTRWFEGEVVSIRTARNDLTVTPNHPVLTSRGWVPAGALQIGDHVFECEDAAAVAPLIDPHDDQVPSRVEEIATALLMAGGRATLGVPATTEAFHGDGMVDGEVDVVWAAGALALNRNAKPLERSVHDGLGLSHGQGDALAEECALTTLCESCAAAANGGVGSSHDLLPTLDAAARVEHQLHLGEGAHRQVMTLEEVAQRGAVTPEALAHVHSGLAGQVSSVEIVDVRKVQFRGHVYNLSTVDGWYFANAIMTHNCLCDVIPVLKDEGDDES